MKTKPKVDSNSQRLKALVLWIEENKTGIEELRSVPLKSRFVGAVTTVLFAGKHKGYKAKILMISADGAALEKKAEEVELQLYAEQQEAKKNKAKRNRAQKPKSGSASEQSIVRALGGKVPPPKELKHLDIVEQKEKRVLQQHQLNGQRFLDSQLLNLSSQPSSSRACEPTGDDLEVDENVRPSEKNEGLSEPNVLTQNVEPQSSECCEAARFIKKFSGAQYRSFFQEVLNLMGDVSPDEVQYLELLDIPEHVKKVELEPKAAKGVYISQTKRDQLKVDFANKPPLLARETLFALFGEETFKMLHVTAKGQKSGSYGIPPNVLTALLAFINNHVKDENKLKTVELTALITKRAPEWRAPEWRSKNKSVGKSPGSHQKRKAIEAKHHEDSFSAVTPPHALPRKRVANNSETEHYEDSSLTGFPFHSPRENISSLVQTHQQEDTGSPLAISIAGARKKLRMNTEGPHIVEGGMRLQQHSVPQYSNQLYQYNQQFQSHEQPCDQQYSCHQQQPQQDHHQLGSSHQSGPAYQHQGYQHLQPLQPLQSLQPQQPQHALQHQQALEHQQLLQRLQHLQQPLQPLQPLQVETVVKCGPDSTEELIDLN
ncbi:uncharacterized protein LOC117647291 [Thrips palmi]|uniref:Uncharacterized protein LOC117647291 n=1 Tax=Thrips palmi TaxID=161013 RepID=A0A6P8ZB99_THRPL|nr:uncharacterized protein LOC117647291 [Thrips palmi]